MTLDAATATICGNAVWKTKDGRVLKWSDMTVLHLRNCAKHLRRSTNQNAIDIMSVSMSLQGEMAQYSAEHALDEALDAMALAGRCATTMEAYAAWRGED
jgi:hypothetical protein